VGTSDDNGACAFAIVNDIANLKPSTMLEQRKGFWATEDCVRDTSACW
jgi:hypothetical protein